MPKSLDRLGIDREGSTARTTDDGPATTRLKSFYVTVHDTRGGSDTTSLTRARWIGEAAEAQWQHIQATVPIHEWHYFTTTSEPATS